MSWVASIAFSPRVFLNISTIFILVWLKDAATQRVAGAETVIAMVYFRPYLSVMVIAKSADSTNPTVAGTILRYHCLCFLFYLNLNFYLPQLQFWPLLSLSLISYSPSLESNKKNSASDLITDAQVNCNPSNLLHWKPTILFVKAECPIVCEVVAILWSYIAMGRIVPHHSLDLSSTPFNQTSIVIGSRHDCLNRKQFMRTTPGGTRRPGRNQD